jgi:predicted metalloendopeptidase
MVAKTRKIPNDSKKLKLSTNKTKRVSYSNRELVHICESEKYIDVEDNLFTKKYEIEMSKKPFNVRDIVEYKKTLIKEFTQISKKDLNYVTKLTKNDFYTFINNDWLEQVDEEKNKKFYVQIDNFRIVQEKVYYELIGYVKQYIKDNPHEKQAIAIKNVYDSLTRNNIESIKKHAKRQLKNIETHIEKGEMYTLLAHINTEEILSWGAPIQWSLLPDEKNVKKYISHLSPPVLSIYDYLIYIEDPDDDKETKQYKKFVKENFFIYIDEVFTACLGKNHGYNPQDIWDIEYDMLEAMGCDTFKKEDPNNYNVVTTDELKTKFDFDWPTFTKLLGYQTPPKKVIVSSLNALKCMTQLYKKNWNTPKWKTYWLFIHYRQLIRFEASLRHIHYKFFKKILEGQPIPTPTEIVPIFALSFCFNTFLSEQYTQHNENHVYESYVKRLVKDLKYLFIRKLKRNTWLSPKTKATAIKKLEKLEIFVGTPGKLRYDPLLNYTNDDPWENMRLLLKWKHKKFVKLEGKDIIDIPEIDWKHFKLVGTQNYMVNAYYRPTSNSIYVPAAYLQPPFIDLKERGMEYNLVFIGYTIGHELSHSLDDMGSNYDENGNLNNWWTDEDRKKFKLKIKDVVNQYEAAAKRDGIKFDAELSVGENLADISGLSLVEEYLIEFNKGNDLYYRIMKLSLEQFYMQVVFQGRQKIYENAIKAQLKMNPHPLEKYRCNCPLARLELFKTIFNIKKGDGMWWHNNDTIW